MKLTVAERVVLSAPLVIVVSVGLLLPAALGLVSTLTNYGPSQRSVDVVGLHNYQVIFADRTLGAAIRNDAVLTLAAVPLQIAFGLGLALALRRPFRGRTVIRVLLLLPWLVSPVASGVLWHFLLDSQTGVLGWALGQLGRPDPPSPLSQHGLALLTVVAVETWRVSPLVAFLLLPGIERIPRDRWEQAEIDGLTRLGRTVHVVLPSLKGLLSAVAMLLVGSALATFDSVLTMTGGGPGTETLTMALYSYNKAFTFGDWPIGASAGWLIGGAVLAAGLVYLRFSGPAEA